MDEEDDDDFFFSDDFEVFEDTGTLNEKVASSGYFASSDRK